MGRHRSPLEGPRARTRAARRGVARWAVRDAGRARGVSQEPGGAREGGQPPEGREDGCRPRRPSAGAHLPARRDRRSAAVGVLRRSLVRTRDLRPAGTRVCGPRPAEPHAEWRHRPGPRRRQRHLDSRPRRAVRTPRLQPRRDPQGQPDPGRAGSGLRAGAGTADRGGLPAHRPWRRRGRRVPDHPCRHRPCPHHRRRPDVRCDRLGNGRRGDPAPPRGSPAAEEADHLRARRGVADHHRARGSGATPTCATRPSTS